jgi:hypothetical protein
MPVPHPMKIISFTITMQGSSILPPLGLRLGFLWSLLYGDTPFGQTPETSDRPPLIVAPHGKLESPFLWSGDGRVSASATQGTRLIIIGHLRGPCPAVPEDLDYLGHSMRSESLIIAVLWSLVTRTQLGCLYWAGDRRGINPMRYTTSYRVH